jgi:uncharacterized protein YjbI with pentapeptide repeats
MRKKSPDLRHQIARIVLLIAVWALPGAAQTPACAGSHYHAEPEPGFHGQTLVNANFSYSDLTGCDFSGATLIAPFFEYANLTNAKFQGAIFKFDSNNPTVVPDFSFATLKGANFSGAKFEAPTYFTGATLTCADFSNTDLSTKNAIFGPSPLNFDKTGCRPSFRGSIMDCEFFADWPFLDLSGANIRACISQLQGFDFSGANLSSVDLTGANLDGTKFVNANLDGAILDDASLQGADLSNAFLRGAYLNRANLTNASLYSASLSIDTAEGVYNAAVVQHAHLKNVNLSSATISGVDFSYSNFYGDSPTAQGICKTAPSISKCKESQSNNYEGFACGCASAHLAVMKGTEFANTYLYGVDFTLAQGQGADFSEAVLTGANFNGAVLSADPSTGARAKFSRAFLQGTNFSGAQLQNTPNLTDAFVDFRFGGNNIFILLDGADHNEFACQNCSPPTGSNVCVLVTYPAATSVHEDVPLTCPNGAVGNCGPALADGSNPKWASPLDIGDPPSGVPPAWYLQNSTYTKAPTDPNTRCNGLKPTVLW